MPEWLETRGSDLLVFVWLFLSFGCMVILTQLGYALLGQILYIVILIVGILLTDMFILYRVSPYPYIQMIVRPINKKLHCFVESATARKIGENLYAADIKLRFPVKFLDYGKINRIKLHYAGEWNKRVDFQPGYASYYGYEVKHPQVEIFEVYQVSRGDTSIDHGEAIPVFFLHSASKDCYYEGLSSQLVGKANPGVIEAYEARIKELEAENADLRQKVAEWQQAAISYESIIEQQKSEIRGLLESKTGVKELAHEYLLTLYQAAGSIESALKHIRGPKLPMFTKWLAITIIAGMVIAFLWANPSIIHSFIYFMQTPSGTSVAIILIIVVAIILYYGLVKKK